MPKDLPSSHQQTNTTDDIGAWGHPIYISPKVTTQSVSWLTTSLDFSTSAASPGASTFLNSASTTAQASPTEGTSGIPSNSDLSSAQPATERSEEIQASSPDADTAVHLPHPADSQAAQIAAATAGGQERSSRRGSRSSIKIPSRKGSTASGRYTKKDRTLNPAVVDPEKSVEEESSENAAKPRKKGVSRFLSILNCCGASKDANLSELDQAVPPKKARTLQPNRGRQATPMTKPSASAGESSNTESKEVIVDDIAGPPYSELTPAAKPKIIEPPKKPTPEMEKLALPNDHLPAAEEKSVPEQSTSGHQPLPPLPSTSTLAGSDDKDVTMINAQEAFNEKRSVTGADAPIEPPPIPPPTTAVADQGISKEEMAVNDRTPQQEARDVEMPDAPPVPSAPEQPVTNQEPAVQSPPQSNLPPPPPIASPSRPSAADQRISNDVTGAEQQKWLLPPIDSRFTGKKCLVLDLDETLVHSSFKVSDSNLPPVVETDCHRYSIKPISRYPWRSRGSTTTSTSSRDQG